MKYCAYALVALALIVHAIVGLSDVIQLSSNQLTDLGITLGSLKRTAEVPVLTAPAEVVIPPGQEHIVSVSEPGLITQMAVAVGDTVKQGQVLALLTSPGILSLQRLYLKAQNELELERLRYLRDQKLLESGVIPQRRWQETRSQYKVFASEADEYRQTLALAGMSNKAIDQLAKSHRLSAELVIHAPFGGVVLERMATVGARLVNAAPLYRIGTLRQLWLEIAVPADLTAKINLGDPVGYNEKANLGRITLIGQSVDRQTQSVPVRAVVIDPPGSLRPGRKLNVRISHPVENAFIVANSAIAQQAGASYIFVRSTEGFQSIPVEILAKQADESIISGQLTGRESIAIKGAAALKAVWLGLGSDE